MKKDNLRNIILLSSIIVFLWSCTVPRHAMQPDGGYSLLKDSVLIKQFLVSRCVDLMHFDNGDVIADIGAGNGYLEGMLSLSFDSLTFYIQDIDSSICNQPEVDKVLNFYKNLKVKPFYNKFIAVTGTDSTTNLPDNACDKILMLNTYQYLKEPKKFIQDVKRKLKNDGLFYVVNPQREKYDDIDSQRKKYGWNASPLETEITEIINCGFELIELSRHYGIQGNPYLMVFKKKSL
jgi:SAM-dependent methyltransferase